MMAREALLEGGASRQLVAGLPGEAAGKLYLLMKRRGGERRGMEEEIKGRGKGKEDRHEGKEKGKKRRTLK